MAQFVVSPAEPEFARMENFYLSEMEVADEWSRIGEQTNQTDISSMEIYVLPQSHIGDQNINYIMDAALNQPG